MIPHILFCSNGLAIWHGLSDISHIKANYGRWSVNYVGKISKTPKGKSTPTKGSVCQKLEKTCSGYQVLLQKQNADIRTSDRRTDI